VHDEGEKGEFDTQLVAETTDVAHASDDMTTPSQQRCVPRLANLPNVYGKARSREMKRLFHR
jgi:hypothetical protein